VNRSTAQDNEIETLTTKLRQHESAIALLYGQLDARSRLPSGCRTRH
jgi:hypothetical protein